MQIVDYSAFTELYRNRPLKGIENVKAFYTHELKVFCKDPHTLLIPLDDHIVHRGDGIFESITCKDRGILNLDKHLERLENSLNAIDLQVPCTLQELRELIIQSATLADFEHGSIRVLIGRGRGGFGVDPRECAESSLYIIASESKAKDESFWQKGLTAARSAVPVKQKYLAKIKSTNYLPNVLMTQEAVKKKVDLVFTFDTANYLAESAICNVAMYKDNTFFFPRFDSILSGTAVLLAIEKAKELGKVELTNITEEMLESAEEVFAIGSTIGCLSVVEYNYQKVGDGTIGKKAQGLRHLLFDSYKENSVAY